MLTALAMAVLAAFGALELLLWRSIVVLRRSFPWLVMRGDEAPPISEDVAEKYVAGSFDPELGWVMKPHRQGSDVTAEGPKAFRIDAKGRRTNPAWENAPATVAVFGDSFAFCRLVDDGETWPVFLSEKLGAPVQNFGVGNYGADQAMLRFEREAKTLDAKVVILAFVPETMARVHSYWKHYFEYGNTLAFKPRFVLEGEKLVLVPQAVQSGAGFLDYRSRLDRIQSLDPFYRSKFLPDVVRFPFSFSLVKRWSRHVPILYRLLAGQLSGDTSGARRAAFEVVLAENARFTEQLYKDVSACRLLRSIMRRFRDGCASVGATPLVVCIPQPTDLALARNGRSSYRDFLLELSRDFQTIDLTDMFLDHGEPRELYVEGSLGPHTSRMGNKLIAEAIAPVARALLSAGGAIGIDDARVEGRA